MKKFLFGIGMMILISLLVMTVSASATSISVDGYLVNYDANTGYPFVDENSRTMVPLRITMESAGAVVGWDSATRTASVNMNGTTVQVPIDCKYILRDGNKVEIDTSAIVKNGRTYLPIRAVLESFGAISFSSRSLRYDLVHLSAYSHTLKMSSLYSISSTPIDGE